VGGIPEVVTEGETGRLVRFEPRSETDVEPRDPDRFARDLAAGVEALLASPAKRAAMGRRARARVEAEFGWPTIARRTAGFYADVIARQRTTS
jgi:glycosyltransferase involved in cell wall biosynthesis